jgi:hypothetical protein
MEHQINTRHKIDEHADKVDDLVKVPLAKIDCGPGEHNTLPRKVAEVLKINMDSGPACPHANSARITITPFLMLAEHFLILAGIGQATSMHGVFLTTTFELVR